MPILSNFLLRAEGGKASIFATNIEHSMKINLNCEITKEGSLCIPYDAINDVIKDMSGTIALQAKGKSRLMVTYGLFSEMEMVAQDPEQFPSPPAINGKEVEIGEDFITALKTLDYAVDDDDAAVFSSICLDFQNETLQMAATDRHQLVVKTNIVNASGVEGRYLLPGKAVKETLKTKPVKMILDDRYLSFEGPQATYVSRVIDGTYPDYAKVIPGESKIEITIDKQQVLPAAKRVAAVLKRSNEPVVRLEISDNKLKLRAASDGVGKIKEEIPLESHTGGEIVVGVNGQYLLNTITGHPDPKITLGFIDPLNPIVTNGTNHIAIVLPIRLQDNGDKAA